MPAPKVYVDAADLDLSLLEFGDLKHYAQSKLPYVPVTYAGGKVLMLTTPEMPMPFGVSTYVPEGKREEEGEKNIDLSFRNPSPEAQAFREKMDQLDQLVLDTSFERSKAWFGKQKTRDTLDDNQNKNFKLAKNPEYGYSMKIKWPKNDDVSFWDGQKTDARGQYVRCREEDCVNNSRGSVVMELRPLWQVQGKFGLKWVAEQVLITERPVQEEGCHWKLPVIAAPEGAEMEQEEEEEEG